MDGLTEHESSFAELLRERDALLVERDELRRECEELRAQVSTLLRRVGALEGANARLETEQGANSQNSGKPPSSDSPKDRANRGGKTKRKGSGRKPGGQPGHKGHQRDLLPPEKVDHTRHLFPSHCKECRCKLPRVPDAEALRHQVAEIPQFVVEVTDYLQHAVVCACGAVTRAELPRGVPRGMCGPNLAAILTLLVGVYHVSRRDVQSLARDVFGIHISLGTISKLEGRVATMLEPAHRQASEVVKRAQVKFADATTWWRKATGRTLWVIASRLATVFHIVPDATRAQFVKLVGTLGVLVTDRGSQFGFWVMEARQICWAHLIRKFVAFSEHANPEVAELGRSTVLLAQVMLSRWHKVRDGTESRDQFQDFLLQFRPVFEGHLRHGVALRLPGVSGACKHILVHCEAMWTFARVPGVEPTNNHAERELRRFVTWRRRSFGSQSERGDHFAERIMTVVHTLRKQKRDVLPFLRDTIAASFRGDDAPSLMA